MSRVDHTWDETYRSDGNFGPSRELSLDMEVWTPTGDRTYVRLCGMISAFALCALENDIPLKTLRIARRRPPHDPFG